MNFVDPGTWEPVNPNNRITDCGTALYAQRSFVNAGDGGDLGELNSIHNNIDYDIYEGENTWVLANYDYWGGAGPRFYVDGSSVLFGADTYLDWDPWVGREASSKTFSNAVSKSPQAVASIRDATFSSADARESMMQKLTAGANYERKGQYSEAINHYTKMVEAGSVPEIALTALARIAGKISGSRVVGYLDSLSSAKSEYRPTAMRLLAGLCLSGKDSAKGIATYERITELFPNTADARDAWFALYYHALFAERNRGQARKLLDRIISQYSKEDVTLSVEVARAMFENDVLREAAQFGREIARDANDGSWSTDTVGNMAGNSGLDQNHPNPFNPSTKISYRIIRAGRVSLKVYDVLGREVIALVSGYQEAGVHTAYFNGQSLASGVYFYRLTAPGVNQIKKMLMTK